MQITVVGWKNLEFKNVLWWYNFHEFLILWSSFTSGVSCVFPSTKCLTLVLEPLMPGSCWWGSAAKGLFTNLTGKQLNCIHMTKWCKHLMQLSQAINFVNLTGLKRKVKLHSSPHHVMQEAPSSPSLLTTCLVSGSLKLHQPARDIRASEPYFRRQRNKTFPPNLLLLVKLFKL